MAGVRERVFKPLRGWNRTGNGEAGIREGEWSRGRGRVLKPLRTKGSARRLGGWEKVEKGSARRLGGWEKVEKGKAGRRGLPTDWTRLFPDAYAPYGAPGSLRPGIGRAPSPPTGRDWLKAAGRLKRPGR